MRYLILLIALLATDANAARRPIRDVTPPTVPTGLTATVISSTEIQLSWTASTDTGTGVKGYKVYRNGSQIASVTTGTTLLNTELPPDTAQGYTVAAFDGMRNTSKQTGIVTATTLPEDPVPPDEPPPPDSQPLTGVPAGIYSIDTPVDKPFVDGVLLRLYWAQVEKTEGVYDFSKVATIVKQAQALGQSVSIANMVVATPSWLLAKCETINIGGNFGNVCAPWDETMLAAMEKLANALSVYSIDGVTIKDLSTVKQIDASIGGIQSIRLTIIPTGYTAQKLQDGVLRSVGIWASAFPNKHLYAGLFGIGDGAKSPSTAEAIRDALMAEFDGVNKPRINFFQEVLTGEAPSLNSALATVVTSVKDKTSVMYQACGEWSNQSTWYWCYWLNGDSPDSGMTHGFNNFNATYFEIYEKDLNNAAFADQFQKWHDKLVPYKQ